MVTSTQMRLLTCAVVLAFACGAACAADLPLKPPRNGGVYVVAHRGAHNGIPENTLPAYQKAIDLDADFVEIDVRATKDGHLVSVHNDSVEDYAKGATGKVADLTLEELRALDVGERVGPEWKGTRIPTFEEILDLCKGRIGIYLDLKRAPIETVVAPIKERGMEHDVIWYISSGAVKTLHEACPECIEMPDPGPERLLPRLLEQVKPRVVASSWENLSESFVDQCHAVGAILIVDDDEPSCWKQMLEWGVDGIQTDHPEDLIQLLKEHPARSK